VRSGIHEIKHDGYRTLLVIEGGLPRAYTRNGFDWSERYPGILSSSAFKPGHGGEPGLPVPYGGNL
jgi:ATP-dependent DNA ligase